MDEVIASDMNNTSIADIQREQGKPIGGPATCRLRRLCRTDPSRREFRQRERWQGKTLGR
jgi:hypothetical protein